MDLKTNMSEIPKVFNIFTMFKFLLGTLVAISEKMAIKQQTPTIRSLCRVACGASAPLPSLFVLLRQKTFFSQTSFKKKIICC